jgi:hypothetical protein
VLGNEDGRLILTSMVEGLKTVVCQHWSAINPRPSLNDLVRLSCLSKDFHHGSEMSQGCSAPRDQEDDELTEEEEDGILAALAEVDAGKGIPLSHVIEMIEGGSRRS